MLRIATLILLGAVVIGAAGCLLVPAPVPVAGPVIVAPRPAYGYYGGGYYGGGYHRPGHGYWRRY